MQFQPHSTTHKCIWTRWQEDDWGMRVTCFGFIVKCFKLHDIKLNLAHWILWRDKNPLTSTFWIVWMWTMNLVLGWEFAEKCGDKTNKKIPKYDFPTIEKLIYATTYNKFVGINFLQNRSTRRLCWCWKLFHAKHRAASSMHFLTLFDIISLQIYE